MFVPAQIRESLLDLFRSDRDVSSATFPCRSIADLRQDERVLQRFTGAPVRCEELFDLAKKREKHVKFVLEGFLRIRLLKSLNLELKLRENP